MRKKEKQGFTLLEILVSVSIIAILTIVGIVSFATVNRRSRDAKRKSDVEQLRSALEMYRADYGNYPNPAACQPGPADASCLDSVLKPTYIPAIAKDPKSNQSFTYRYKANSQSGGYYYGYCLTVYLETAAADENNCNPTTDADQTNKPSGAMLYATKNP